MYHHMEPDLKKTAESSRAREPARGPNARDHNCPDRMTPDQMTAHNLGTRSQTQIPADRPRQRHRDQQTLSHAHSAKGAPCTVPMHGLPRARMWAPHAKL